MRHNLRIAADRDIAGLADFFSQLGEIEAHPGRSIERRDLTATDLLLVRSITPVGESLLRDTPVRFVGSATSGFDHVDRDYLDRCGIGFAYAPGSNANSVVEYVLSAIACSGDHLERLLRGGRVGIVGYGMIGRALTRRLGALGIDSCWYDPWLEPGPGAAPMNEVLQSQVVSLHAELTTKEPWPSYHLLGPVQLAAMAPEQLLINASRGAVVDNAALLELLRGGQGPGVVLDVWEGEPRLDQRLLPYLLFGTAHIAGYSLDGKLQGTRMLFEAANRQLHLGTAMPAAAGPAVQTLRLSAGGGRAGFLRRAITTGYDIREDDRLLRATCTGDQGPGEGFDSLRREYRVRRELAHSRVEGNFSADELGLLEALGCCT